MGKKSKTKKALRELKEKTPKEPQKKEFFKFFSKNKSPKSGTHKPDIKDKKNLNNTSDKESGPSTPKATTPKRKNVLFRLHIHKKKIFGSILALIMVGILISVGYLLFQKAFRAQPVAKLLPAESTIALLEINTNFDHNQLIKAFKLLENHPRFSKKLLIEKVEKYFLINYENDLKSWLGRQTGIAFLNIETDDPEDTELQKIYFIESISKKNTDKFLKKYKPTITTYSGQKTYQIEGSFFLSFINDYLVITHNQNTLFQIIDFQKNKNDKLYNSERYRKIDNNLPLNRTAFLYLDFDKINNNFLQQFSFLQNDSLNSETILTLLKLFNAEGVCLVSMDNNFALQSFITLDESIVENSQYLSMEQKYNAQLATYLSPDTLTFWGGQNLENQLKRLVEILAGGKNSSLALFENILQNYSQKYFGEDLDLNKDILPLFGKEYAFAIEEIDNKTVYKFIFELDDPETEINKLHRLANNFASIGALFEPKIVEHTLPDGTIGREVVAIPEEIIKIENNYQEFIIYELKMGKQGWGIYYTVINNIAVVATDFESVKNTLDIVKNSLPNLKTSKIFTTSIDPILKSSDEITFLNLEKILNLLWKDKNKPVFLDLISFFSSGRNYFNDGIVTINYIHLK